MKIALDFDDVICNSVESILAMHNSKTGQSAKFEDIDRYYWFSFELVEEFNTNHDVKDVKPIEMAIESINSLLNAKDELYVITARPERYRHKVESWIKHHLKTDKIKVLHVDSHAAYGSKIMKSKICKELGISLIVEDSGENAMDCAENEIKVILFDNPWNKKFNHKNIKRVKGWNEAKKIIDEKLSSF